MSRSFRTLVKVKVKVKVFVITAIDFQLDYLISHKWRVSERGCEVLALRAITV